MTRNAPKLDWTAATALLADRATSPTMLLDRGGRMWLCNRAMEELLGRPRLELIGRHWIDELVPTDGREVARFRFDEALQGTVDSCECAIRIDDGGTATATFEVTRIGHGRSIGVLASVVRTRRPTSGVEHHGIVDLRYQVSVSAHDFGRILGVRAADEPIAAEHLVGARCYVAIHRRDSPCVGCPALAGDGGRRTSVVVSGWDDAPFAVVTAEAARDGAREVTARFVGDSVTSGLMRARVQALAESRGLSAREREVLSLLLHGRSYADIGHVLGIGERTVKYHQGNILDKLGADSRVDLMRLFF